MPKGMHQFSMPEVPTNADEETLLAASAILKAFLTQMKQWRYEHYGQGPQVDLRGVNAKVLQLLADVLGEGEVSATIQQSNGHAFNVQESVFTGVWQIKEIDSNGKPVNYWLEAASFPFFASELAISEGSKQLLLAELSSHLSTFQIEQPAHVVNLTLMPLSQTDHQLLAEIIAPGAISITSRSYGSCKVHSTNVAHIWRVLYFNNNESLILNTLEVVTIPSAVQAAKEDIEDSIDRLAELLEWMKKSQTQQE